MQKPHTHEAWTSDSLKQEAAAVARLGSSEDADVAGARPLAPITTRIATELAESLPTDVPKPDVDATAHGEIDFDWTIERGCGLTISVGPDGDVAFAGIFHGAKISGQEPWRGALPGFVECCLERLRREAR